MTKLKSKKIKKQASKQQVQAIKEANIKKRGKQLGKTNSIYNLVARLYLNGLKNEAIAKIANTSLSYTATIIRELKDNANKAGITIYVNQLQELYLQFIDNHRMISELLIQEYVSNDDYREKVQVSREIQANNKATTEMLKSMGVATLTAIRDNRYHTDTSKDTNSTSDDMDSLLVMGNEKLIKALRESNRRTDEWLKKQEKLNNIKETEIIEEK